MIFVMTQQSLVLFLVLLCLDFTRSVPPYLIINDNDKLCVYVNNIADYVPVVDGWRDGSSGTCPDLDYEWMEEDDDDLKFKLYHDMENQKCQNTTTCLECLTTNTKFGYECSYHGGCQLGGVDGGFYASLETNFDEEKDDLQAVARHRCDEYEGYKTNQAVCYGIPTCQDCLATELPMGDGFCLWFPDHDGWCSNRAVHTSQTALTSCTNVESSTDVARYHSYFFLPLVLESAALAIIICYW